MKFTCNQIELNSAIQLVSKAVSTKTTINALTGIFFQAEKEKLRLIGNDLNMMIEIKINADIKQTGSAIVPARIISELIKKIPAGEIDIESDDNGDVKIHANGIDYKLLSYNANDYPEIKLDSKPLNFQIDKDIFASMIKQTSFAISKEESRPTLTGALLELMPNQFKMVAIDGFRMAIKSITIDNQLEKKVIVPEKSLSELQKIISSFPTDEKLNIAIHDKHIVFHLENIIFASRLIAGEFVNYEQILPKEFKTNFKTSANDFYQALDRSSLLARENKNVVVKLEITDDQMKIISNSEAGTSNENVNITLDGADQEIGFNPNFLLDVLRVMHTEEINIQMINAVSPCIIKSTEDKQYTYLVLPCRIAKS